MASKGRDYKVQALLTVAAPSEQVARERAVLMCEHGWVIRMEVLSVLPEFPTTSIECSRDRVERAMLTWRERRKEFDRKLHAGAERTLEDLRMSDLIKTEEREWNDILAMIPIDAGDETARHIRWLKEQRQIVLKLAVENF